MYVNGVGRAAPGLELLGDFLGVGWSEDANDAGVFEGIGEVVQKSGDSIGEANRGEDTGAEKGVAAESVVERVLGTGDGGVYPGEVRQLFKGEGGDWAFVAFAYPLKGEVIAIGL